MRFSIPEFLFGLVIGAAITLPFARDAAAPKAPTCTMESGTDIWSRKRQDIPCPMNHTNRATAGNGGAGKKVE